MIRNLVLATLGIALVTFLWATDHYRITVTVSPDLEAAAIRVAKELPHDR